MLETALFEEANRQLVICNACRYCEGLCAVFQAVERRREFSRGDIAYLANLCHDCRACYTACMYTPPHEFQINIPKIMSEARVESYQRWTWPKSLSSSFTSAGIRVALGGAAFLLVLLMVAVLVTPAQLAIPQQGPGAFYRIIPYWAMVSGALGLAGYWIAIWIYGAIRCWKDFRASHIRITATSIGKTLWAIATLVYLRGGGGGCDYPENHPSDSRRTYHSFVFWGFLFDLASTTLAFVYQDFMHRQPPYPVMSLPVLLGTLGGIALLVGALGLLVLKVKSDRTQASAYAVGMDYSFLLILFLVSLTGLLTLVLRSTAGLGFILTIHLAFVASMFFTAPYGKFVHAIYRSLALLNFHLEGKSRI